MASRIRILNCYNAFCSHNENNKCELEEITLDYNGECEKKGPMRFPKNNNTFRTYTLTEER